MGCEPGLVFGDTDKFVWEGGVGRAPQVMDNWGLSTVTCPGPRMPNPAASADSSCLWCL